ncbi:hypothetical protein Hanom_Chr12g01086181 [Helianthus anomalus]
MAYDNAARSLRGPKDKTNFPLQTPSVSLGLNTFPAGQYIQWVAAPPAQFDCVKRSPIDLNEPRPIWL